MFLKQPKLGVFWLRVLKWQTLTAEVVEPLSSPGLMFVIWVQIDFLSRTLEFLDVAEGLASATCKRIRQITPERTHPKIANAIR